MIIYIALAVLFAMVVFELYIMFLWKEFLRQDIKANTAKIENNEDRLIKSAECIAELADRIDSVEDYMKMIRSETENDKHKDYWQSVMDYNPLIEKEGEK